MQRAAPSFLFVPLPFPRSLELSSPPLVSLPAPAAPSSRSAELELSPPSRAASGGGAKSRLFLAPGEQSRLPGAERTRRGGKPACGRQARAGARGEGKAEASPCARSGAQPLRGQGAAPTHPGLGPARTREPVGEVAAVVLGSRSFSGPGTA